MDWLILLGLVIFIALHSLRGHFPDVRSQLIEQLGVVGFRIVYSALTLLALSLIGFGLQEARLAPVQIWSPDPAWRECMGYAMWFVGVGVAASWIPGTHLRVGLKQPLLIAIVLWSFLHLTVSAFLHQWIISLAVLVWVLSVLWRDWPIVPAPALSWWRDITAIVLGTLLWFGFGEYFHPWIIGVPVFLF